jgi:hypothetical protein
VASLDVRPFNSFRSVTKRLRPASRLVREGSENLVRTLLPKLLAVVLFSGEPACVVWVLTGAVCFTLIVGLAAGVSVLLGALRSGG